MYAVPNLINVIVAHSQPLFCKGLDEYFRKTSGICINETLSVAAALEEAVQKTENHVLVLDDMLVKDP